MCQRMINGFGVLADTSNYIMCRVVTHRCSVCWVEIGVLVTGKQKLGLITDQRSATGLD